MLPQLISFLFQIPRPSIPFTLSNLVFYAGRSSLMALVATAKSSTMQSPSTLRCWPWHSLFCFFVQRKRPSRPSMTTPTWRRGCMKRNQRKIPPNIGMFFFFGFGVSSQPAAFGKIRMLELTVEMPPCCFHRNGYTWKPIAGWCTLQPSCLSLEYVPTYQTERS